MDKRAIILFLCLTLAFLGIDAWFGKKKPQAPQQQQQELPVAMETAPPFTPTTHGDEQFYVLENAYQQLVFSTRGGSLAEINLPLQSSKDSKSIVKEIDADRLILAQAPHYARFPLHSYSIVTDDGVVTRSEGALGGYYPLLRRDMTGLAEYYAFNLIGEEEEIPNYRVTRFEKNLIEFQTSSGGRRITKTFWIPQENNGPYCLQLDVAIDGKGPPLWMSSGVPDVELVGGSYSPLLRFQEARGKSFDVETIDLPKKGPTWVTTARPNWISNCNGFLGIILDPLTPIGEGYKALQIAGTTLPTRLSLIDGGRLYKPDSYPGYITYLPLKSAAATFRIFAGPFDEKLLKELDALYDNPLQGYNPDYASAQSIQGWFSFISQPFAKFLFLLMQFFHVITRSWAASIVLLTIALRAMMYPLNAWSIRSSAKMQALAPKVQELRDRYKKDPKRAQVEVMQLYRNSGANPATGCLPLFLQMPFLIGMFYLLKSSFPLRGAVFIPGWIDDLAAPDLLFSWKQPIWFIGNAFHLLPILMGVAMFFQQRMTTKPQAATTLSDTQRQQVAMNNIMSIMFMVFFYNVPSGLNLYFMFSTLLGILQQRWMQKKMKTTPVIVKS